MAAGTDCHRHDRPQQRLRRQQQLLHRRDRVRRREWPERQRTQQQENSGTTIVQTPSACRRHGPVEQELPEEDGPEEEVLPEEQELPEQQKVLEDQVDQDEKKAASARDCWRSQHHSTEESLEVETQRCRLVRIANWIRHHFGMRTHRCRWMCIVKQECQKRMRFTCWTGC